MLATITLTANAVIPGLIFLFVVTVYFLDVDIK